MCTYNSFKSQKVDGATSDYPFNPYPYSNPYISTLMEGMDVPLSKNTTYLRHLETVDFPMKPLQALVIG